jgi:polyhydroxyalkanoate synthesis regulator phasin
MNEELDIVLDPIEEKLNEIAIIKQKLSLLDHKTNKYIEGKLSEAEWLSVVAKRDELRAHINALEAEIIKLKEAQKSENTNL